MRQREGDGTRTLLVCRRLRYHRASSARSGNLSNGPTGTKEQARTSKEGAAGSKTVSKAPGKNFVLETISLGIVSKHVRRNGRHPYHILAKYMCGADFFLLSMLGMADGKKRGWYSCFQKGGRVKEKEPQIRGSVGGGVCRLLARTDRGSRFQDLG